MRKKERNPLNSTPWEKFCYGMGDVGVNLVWTLPSSFLMLYYTDSVGISAAYIGTMMLICRLFDGFSDVLMGVVIDKTHTRWGKARPWLMLMTLPMLLSIYFTFKVPTGEVGMQKAYTFISYFIMSVICYTAVNLSYHSMLPRFSLTSQDRASVSALRSIFALIVSVVVATITPMLLAGFGGSTSQAAWSKLNLIYCVVAFVAIMITFSQVKEKKLLDENEQSKQAEPAVPLKEAVKILLSTRYFYISVFLFLSFYISNGTSGIMIYYARDVLGNENLMGLLSMSGMVPLLLAMPFVPALFKKFGKQKPMFVGMIISALCAFLMLLNPKNLMFYVGLSIVKSLASAPVMSAMYTFAGDIVDFNQWKHGIRTEGIATSVNSIGMKLGTGLGSALLGWMLAWGKYDAALAAQPSSAITAMIIVAIVIPALVSLASAVLLYFWDMEKYQPEIIAYLSNREKANNN